MTDIHKLLDLAIQIQQISAPTFAEKMRAEFVRDLFEKENLKDVSIDSIGNVYARMQGKNKTIKPLVVTAHLDTVFPSSTNLQVKKEARKVIAPGIGDNSLGVAGLFGIVWSLKNLSAEDGGKSNDKDGGKSNDKDGGKSNDKDGGKSNDKDGGKSNDKDGGKSNDKDGGKSNDKDGGKSNDKDGGKSNDKDGGKSNDKDGGKSNDNFSAEDGGKSNDKDGGKSIPKLNHDVWLVANVGEEGLGDLRGMREVVERFKENPSTSSGQRVMGYLVLEGMALGYVYHRAIGVKRYRITTKTAGGHSWSDYGSPSAVHELANLITKLTSLRLPKEPRTTMNVGTIHGGTGVNVLASEAKCELDLRSENPKTLAKLVHQVEDILIHAGREGVKVSAEVIGERPAGEISAEHELVKLAVKCLEEQNLSATLTTGSTDANIPLSQNIPAVVLGITTGGGAHTVNEYIDINGIEKGMASVVRFVEEVGNWES